MTKRPPRARFTVEAEKDLLRLYDFLLERNVDAAAEALEAIESGVELARQTPYSCRKALPSDPFLRELVIPFGSSGYIALFRIDRSRGITVLAVRHQREDDYS